MPEGSTAGIESLPPKLTKIDIIIGTVTIVVLFCVFALLLHTLLGQISSYQQLLAGPTGVGQELVFARAADAAIIKTCSIFLAFVLMFLGALYTFRVASVPYRLAAEGEKTKGTFETASPGLVMITLGMILICFAMWKEYTITVERPSTVGQLPTKQTTASAIDGVKESGFGREEIASINTALALLHSKRPTLTEAEAETFSVLLPKLDQFRRSMIFQIYPQMRQSYDALAAKYAANPISLGQLSAEERESFESVQQLLSEQIEGRKK
ncbi:MAG: hypothetical protein JNJ50_24000 [Acidobacteria bacterium]|nr:hypothetical protein [Acidobacteriota bacterium]